MYIQWTVSRVRIPCHWLVKSILDPKQGKQSVIVKSHFSRDCSKECFTFSPGQSLKKTQGQRDSSEI